MNWSPPNEDTQGLIPPIVKKSEPVPNAIKNNPMIGPNIGILGCTPRTPGMEVMARISKPEM